MVCVFLVYSENTVKVIEFKISTTRTFCDINVIDNYDELSIQKSSNQEYDSKLNNSYKCKVLFLLQISNQDSQLYMMYNTWEKQKLFSNIWLKKYISYIKE